MGVEADGGRHENGTPRVWVSAVRSPEGSDFTLLLINDGFRRKQVRVRFDAPGDCLE